MRIRARVLLAAVPLALGVAAGACGSSRPASAPAPSSIAPPATEAGPTTTAGPKPVQVDVFRAAAVPVCMRLERQWHDVEEMTVLGRHPARDLGFAELLEQNADLLERTVSELETVGAPRDEQGYLAKSYTAADRLIVANRAMATALAGGEVEAANASKLEIADAANEFNAATYAFAMPHCGYLD